MARWIGLVMVVFALLAAGPARGEVMISAAVSLKGALEKAKPELEKAAGEPVSFTFGACGTLAKQVKQGAPVDLFIASCREGANNLVEAKSAEAGTEVGIAGNELVLIVRGDPAEFQRLVENDAQMFQLRITKKELELQRSAAPAGPGGATTRLDLEIQRNEQQLYARNRSLQDELRSKSPTRGPSLTSFADLAGESVKRLAIGEPNVVPAGAYAKEVLEGLGLWQGMDKAGKLITAENVAAALTYVERGEVDVGIVYATEAKSSKSVSVVATSNATQHTPIEYVSVLVTGSKNREAAAKVQTALKGETVQVILKEFGFTPPPSPAPATLPENAATRK